MNFLYVDSSRLWIILQVFFIFRKFNIMSSEYGNRNINKVFKRQFSKGFVRRVNRRTIF